MVTHDRRWAWLWGSEEPFSIGWVEPCEPADSGYTVICGGAPDPLDVPETGEHPAVAVVCVGCLLEDHPEIEPGLMIAAEYGIADLDGDGEWVVGDLARLEPAS